jgi:hypothetical protein
LTMLRRTLATPVLVCSLHPLIPSFIGALGEHNLDMTAGAFSCLRSGLG